MARHWTWRSARWCRCNLCLVPKGCPSRSPAVSSDPAVVGPLTSSPQPLVAEFRAWAEGMAEITVPQSACIHPGSDQVPCNGPFVVSVTVR